MSAFRIYRTPDYVLIQQEEDWFQPDFFSFDALFQASDAKALLVSSVQHWPRLSVEPIPEDGELLPPLENQEVWAAGVTYFRSRVARMEESEEAGGDRFYDMVYDADRPELFMKATASRAVGHRQIVSVRSDSTWDVPEPELTLAINRSGKIFGYTVGNDMSSRDIEGQNPLYLPQAKIYRNSCALGPALVIADPPQRNTPIRLSIERNGSVVFSGESALAQIKRPFENLVDYLFLENSFPVGCYLMTGTGIVPPSDITLQSGDHIKIEIETIGRLENCVG